MIKRILSLWPYFLTMAIVLIARFGFELKGKAMLAVIFFTGLTVVVLAHYIEHCKRRIKFGFKPPPPFQGY